MSSPRSIPMRAARPGDGGRDGAAGAADVCPSSHLRRTGFRSWELVRHRDRGHLRDGSPAAWVPCAPDHRRTPRADRVGVVRGGPLRMDRATAIIGGAMTRGRVTLLIVLLHTSAREVAARCRVSPSRVSEWSSGKNRPSRRARLALESSYGIRTEEWDAAFSREERYTSHRLRRLATDN
jgi:hypothetical protein